MGRNVEMENLLNDITVKLEKFRKIVEKRDEYESSLETLDEMIQDSKEPLLVMVMGEFSTGKSTFINALVGEKVAAVNATPTTAVITKLCYGENEKTIVHYKDGSKEENPDVDFVNLTAENQAAFQRHDEMSFVERRIPMDMLKSMSIIDSPGLNSIKMGHTAATRDFIDKADTVLWMFDANKPVSQTEIAAMAKLNPRLEPIAIVNKMDTLNDDEDDESAFLDGIRQKLKDKVQKVIGISAKLAFIGKQSGNEKQLAASNLQEFYNTIDELVLPNINEYKINTLLSGMGDYICDIEKQVNIGEKIAVGLQDEDYKSYMEEKKWQTTLRDGLDEVLAPMHKFAVSKKKNTTAKTFLAILYQYGFYVEKNEDLAEKMFEEAALHNNVEAQLLLVGLYALKYQFEKCVYWLHKIDEQDRAEAQYLLGLCYEKGLGVEENVEKSVEYYQKAAKQEDGQGLYELAQNYMVGYGVPEDKKKAIELLEKAVTVGNEDSMVALAYRYEDGELLPKDEKKAFDLYERAAKKGDAEGQVNLARCYRQGIGTEIDLKKDVYWLRRAALQDNATAQYCLGMAYKVGHGVDENQARSIIWFKRAADNDDTDAMKKLAELEENPEKAFEWLLKAAEAGDVEAQVSVGHHYYKGEGGENSYSKAFEWFNKAAEAGNTDAMWWLGTLYKDGDGVDKDYDEAVKWFKKASDIGDSYAMCSLGLMYEQGLGGNADYSEAEKLYRKAADLGNGYAMSNLGWLYYSGNGVKQDYEEAIKWYQKAVDAGDSKAEEYLNNVTKELEDRKNVDIFVQQADKYYEVEDYKNAFNFYKKAAEIGDSSSMHTVGWLYAHGYGVEQNYQEAMNWYLKAAELGNEISMNNIGYMYQNGEGVKQDHKIALEWYEKAAELGNAIALKNIGYLYDQKDSYHNYNLAMKYFLRAVENLDSDDDLMNTIGHNYDYGLGVKQDYVEAMKWYRKAVALGNGASMNNIGYMYHYGRGVTRNYNEAKAWYEKAIAAGYDVSKKYLEDVQNQINGVDKTTDSSINESNTSIPTNTGTIKIDDSKTSSNSNSSAGCAIVGILIGGFILGGILSAINPILGFLVAGLTIYFGVSSSKN